MDTFARIPASSRPRPSLQLLACFALAVVLGISHAPMAVAAPQQIQCDEWEQGPNGLQCKQQEPKLNLMQVCELEQGPNGPQCKKKGAGVDKIDCEHWEQGPNGPQCGKKPNDNKVVDVELCKLEQGPNGWQCAGADPKDPKDPEDPKDPDKPEDPKAPEDPDKPEEPKSPKGPSVSPAAVAEPKPSKQVSPRTTQEDSSDSGTGAQGGIPEFEIAASPSEEEPVSGPARAGWIGLGLILAGLLAALVRRRRAAEEVTTSSEQP